MVQCHFCSDNVSMPYKCSLCGNRHCSKHRLPESHKCTNLGIYSTDSYRKQKLEKKRLPQNTIISSNMSYGGVRGGTRGNFWTSGDETKNVLYSGLLVGLIAVMPILVRNFSNIIFLPGAMIYSTFGMFMIYFVRKRVSQNYGMDTHFRFWPIGIALTIIFSLFGSFWILIGYFFIDGEEHGRSRAITGVISTLVAVGIFLLSFFIPILIPPLAALGFSIPSRLFLLMVLLNMIPMWGLDGQKLYEWESKYYWLMLILTIFLIIAFAGLIFN